MAELRSQLSSFFSRRRSRRDRSTPTMDRKESIPRGYININLSYTLSQGQIAEFNELKDELQSRNRALQASRAGLVDQRKSNRSAQPRKFDQKKPGNGNLRLSRKSKTWPARIGMENEQVRDAEDEFMKAVARLSAFMEEVQLSSANSPRIDTAEVFSETTQAKDSNETEDPLLSKYYETAGQVKLIYQELVEEDWAYHDEKVRRNLLTDQEEQVSVADSEFEATHLTERKQLEERLDTALAKADELRDDCIAHGLTIEMPEISEQVDIQPVDTYEVLLDKSQSEPMSPDAGYADLDAAVAASQSRMTSVSHNDLRSSVISWRQTVDPNDQETEQTEARHMLGSTQVSPVSPGSEKGMT